MNGHGDVTVVIPSRDRIGLLPRAVRGVLAQEDVEIRVVVVDDGSVDGTEQWTAGISDPRVAVVRHARSLGLPAARNRGIAAAATPYVAFCDDDDLWAPAKLRSQLAAMAAEGCRWSATGAVMVDDQLDLVGHCEVPGGDVLSKLLVGNPVGAGASSVVAERALLEEVGGFDESLRASEDWELWVRLAQRSPLAVVPRPLVAYRVAAGTMSGDVERMRASRAAVLERHGGDARGGLRAYELWMARQLLRAGAGPAAAAVYARVAARHWDVGSGARALAALLAPRALLGIGLRAQVARVPAAWREEARAWLRPFAGSEDACEIAEAPT